MMVPGTEGKGSLWFFSLSLSFFFYLDCINEYLQTVDISSHHCHWRTRSSHQKGAAAAGAWDNIYQAPVPFFISLLSAKLVPQVHSSLCKYNAHELNCYIGNRIYFSFACWMLIKQWVTSGRWVGIVSFIWNPMAEYLNWLFILLKILNINCSQNGILNPFQDLIKKPFP